MASSLGCLTDSLPQLNTSFLQLQVRVIGEKVDARSIALCFDSDLIRLLLWFLRFTRNRRGEPVLQELLDRLCESSNGCLTSKKSSELMIVDMLLLDKKARLIQGSVSVSLDLHTFVVLELPDKTKSVQTHPPKIATAEKSKHVASGMTDFIRFKTFRCHCLSTQVFFMGHPTRASQLGYVQSSNYKSAMNRITSTKSNILSPSSTISIHGNLAPSGDILGGTHCQERQRAGCGHAPMTRRLCTRTQLIVKFFTPVRSSSRSDQRRNPRPSRLSLSPMLKKYSIQRKEGNDYPGDDMLGIGAVETSPSPVVNRNVSVNTKDRTADGMVVGETTETNAPSDPC
uniref:Uncharacterized protein n=1 Tax=Brassica oleracea var. oleracea TaxID=109376 RepID=A0A0D3C2M9_BRAOL